MPLTHAFRIFRFDQNDAPALDRSANDPHQHDFEELIIGEKGSLEHFIDFNTVTIEAPFVCFVTRGKVHRIKPVMRDGLCSFRVIRFKSEFIADTTFSLYAYYHGQANLVLKADSCFSRLSVLCDLMEEESGRQDPDYGVLRNLLIALISMIEAERKRTQTNEPVLNPSNSTTFRNFLLILEENFRRPLGVEFYAEKLFMSSRNLNLICQNILHQSVSEIVEARKLLEAKNLLMSTDKTVAEIGFELGFNEKSYFTAVFKKKSGQTPSEFREEMRKLISGT